MRTHEGTDSHNCKVMAIPENSQTNDEPRVTCVVRDLTSTTSQLTTVTLPTSYSVDDLVAHISKQYGYQPASFKLLYERNHQMEEFNYTGSKLSDVLSTSDRRKKHKFQLTELEDGVLPVEVQEAGDVSNNRTASKSSGKVAFDDFTPSSNIQMNTYGPVNNVGSSGDSRYIMPSSSNSLPDAADFCGLVNQAMTCYLNSLLQTLFMTPEFRNALYRWEYLHGNQTQTPEEKCIPYQLQKLFLQMQTGNHRSVETTPVTRSFGWDSSHSWQQHDVQELCRVMFDALEINWKKTDQADLINNLYQGKLKDYVKCLECKTESFRTDAYLDIPLVIKPFGATYAYSSVEAALKAFIAPEILEGNNQYQCDNCNKKCDAHKGLKFQTFPYLLTLQLKRFDFDYTTMNRIKLNDRITFPLILDLNGLIDDDSMPPTPGVAEDGSFEPGFSIDRDEDYTCEVNDEYAGPQAAQQLIDEKGEYMYELFSIMIHSGSAVGGHYYAYIKSFTDRLWYSFNDQQVTRITKDDITKTYGGVGGSSRGSMFSSSYTSSTNAYMLMYRKIDPNSNSDFLQHENFPPHIRLLMERIEEEKEAVKKARQVEKSTCKIRTYVNHPVEGKFISKNLEVHKDVSLAEATQEAFKLFELSEEIVPLENVRLVTYNNDLDSIEKSFNDSDDASCRAIGDILGGVKSFYTFSLLLEIKQGTQEWQHYKPGGITYKVHLVDTSTGIVEEPVGIRAAMGDTVSSLKQYISKFFGLEWSDNMRCVLEQRTSETLDLLDDDSKQLRSISFGISTKIYVEKSPPPASDSNLPFQKSTLHSVITLYQNSSCVVMTIPSAAEIEHYLEKEKMREDAHNQSIAKAYEQMNLQQLSKSNIHTANSSDIFTNTDKVITNADEVITNTDEVITNTDEFLKNTDNSNATNSNFVNSKSHEFATDVSNGASSAPSKHSPPPPYDSIIDTSDTQPAAASQDSIISHICGSGDLNSDDAAANKDDDVFAVEDDMPLGTCATDKSDEDNALYAANTSDHEGDDSPAPNLSLEGGSMLQTYLQSDSQSASLNKARSSPVNSHEAPSEQRVSKDTSRDEDCWDYTGCAVNTSSSSLTTNTLTTSSAASSSSTIPSGTVALPSTSSSLPTADYSTNNLLNHQRNDEDEETVFREQYRKEIDSKTLELTVQIDRRATLSKLKRVIGRRFKIPTNHLKLFRIYSNNQETECTSENDALSLLGNGSRMSLKLSRVLAKGEYLVKMFELHVNSSKSEAFTLLMELIVTKGMSVSQIKDLICKELADEHNRHIPKSRLMLRKKTWKNPHAVHHDDSRIDHEIFMYTSCEMFVQVLDETEELEASQGDMVLFIQQWKPSVYQFGDMFQMAVPTSADVSLFKSKISAVTGIPSYNVEIAKGRGTFPGEVSVLDAHTNGLEWNPSASCLTSWPLYAECGTVIIFRDKQEKLGRLTEEMKKDISLRENNSFYRSSSSMYSRKEKALKIYTFDTGTDRGEAEGSNDSANQHPDLD